ncbi:Tumor necrosis factor receptor superfamily member 1A Tumor necrosis factor receptor 1 [Channa argus]|uniref:Tumor necrosis factor receptor superfamily member 1A Tumor necrosis factor receptor 1 n=1 Tax=Channa argus TaxID=215402 RepID=A0A6G1PQ08_CHAAH|nr:Tumor necrosis factor receptor superfamily member 1A Tumor necrosis factor receptor 1 [Channa argus]
MEGQRGRWNKKAPAGIILILMCMCIPSLTLLETTKEPCPHGDFLTEEGNCCNKCSPGFKLLKVCPANGQRSNCVPCPLGQYSDQMNYMENCYSCKHCKETKNEFQVSECKPHKNTICQCKQGYYKYNIDSVTYECRKCTTCGPNELTKETCTPEKNTVCECDKNFYKVKTKCEPCTNCTSNCIHHCSTSNPSKVPPEEPPSVNTFLMKAIAVVAVTALVLLVLVVVITHKTTKRFTKKKLLKLSSEPTSVSVDSFKHVLINVNEPRDNQSVKAVNTSLLSEQESSNLPDCVPLEIRIPDLIYTVLDLVPVQQMKQLVRTLGVKDTEIEQAEMDHRSCREAHYQMLRVWAERGSRAGAGGRGTMLHQPLLEDLLDQLRKMHLGHAAEELETKYPIQ